MSGGRKAIFFISSVMEEILGVSDRIIVMLVGEIAGEVQKENFQKASSRNTRLEEHSNANCIVNRKRISSCPG
jgi:ABC-type sugar transport system ATPase subunit